MMLKTGSKIHAIHSQSYIELLELKEHNYGRLLWKFEFVVEGQPVKDQFINEQAALVAELEGFQIDSPDGAYLFLPLASGFLLYDRANKVYKKLPRPSGIGANAFKSNSFNSSFLTLRFQHEVLVFSSATNHSFNLVFDAEKIMLLNAQVEKDNLLLELKGLESYEKKEIMYKIPNGLKW
ncbi:hypothetical protein [Croceiramulus getboli]|nr:hypothetical protein P8624_06595 [Flavobacteriaceae bacterium YJPT1-3]